LQRVLPVVSTRLVAGQVEIRVVAETQPEGGLESTAPSLEDVYFATLLQYGMSLELE
jgi:hypothetical protein